MGARADALGRQGRWRRLEPKPQPHGWTNSALLGDRIKHVGLLEAEHEAIDKVLAGRGLEKPSAGLAPCWKCCRRSPRPSPEGPALAPRPGRRERTSGFATPHSPRRDDRPDAVVDQLVVRGGDRSIDARKSMPSLADEWIARRTSATRLLGFVVAGSDSASAARPSSASLGETHDWSA